MIFEKSFFSKNIFLLQKVDANASQLFDSFFIFRYHSSSAAKFRSQCCPLEKKIHSEPFPSKIRRLKFVFLNQPVKLLIYEPNASLIFLSEPYS